MKRAAGMGGRVRGAAAAMVACVAALMSAASARAELIELKWPDAGRFERTLTIEPAKFVEVCGPLAAGQAVRWSFEADHPVNFNVHYHVGKDVHYPAKQESVLRLQGDLLVDTKQAYCWMWSNKTTTTTTLTVTLTRT